jgi:hypothetical protein
VDALGISMRTATRSLPDSRHNRRRDGSLATGHDPAVCQATAVHDDRRAVRTDGRTSGQREARTSQLSGSAARSGSRRSRSQRGGATDQRCNLFDPNTGATSCVMDGTYITGIRTAASAVVSARMLSRSESRIATVIGAGVQGREHVRLLPLIRNFERINVCSLPFEDAQSLWLGAKSHILRPTWKQLCVSRTSCAWQLIHLRP